MRMGDEADVVFPELWLGLSSTAWSGVAAIATVVAVAVALGGAILVVRQIRQARELAEDQARPYVVPMFEGSDASWILHDFVIRNIGSTAARQLTMTIDPPYVRIEELQGNEFMETAFISGPTNVLAPGAELRTFFDSSSDMSQAKARGARPQPFRLTLRYLDRRDKEIVEQFDMDPWERLGTVRTEVHNLHHIAKTLRAWSKNQGVNNY